VSTGCQERGFRVRDCLQIPHPTQRTPSGRERAKLSAVRVYKNEKEAGGGEFAIKFACSGSPEAAAAASAEPNALRLQLPAPGSLINRRARRNE
jgi:hypothetical protein